ncbi:hypothetical protein C8R46DRAFT_1218359 [Mycena filopes]|nr:hypothetical protein C8R46DRAFT_1218359 [Mycena filopes]
MDPEPQPEDEYTSPAAADEQEFTSRGGGMFAGSQNFVIAGGTFNNFTTPAVPTDLRMLPLGDIDLQQQLSVESGSGIISGRRERHCARRVYSAKVGGHQANVTVAVYQGDGAEEDWREDVEMYLAVRHPNIVQPTHPAYPAIFAQRQSAIGWLQWLLRKLANIHATVFYGDLVPLKQYMARYPPIMKVYLYACHATEWEEVDALNLFHYELWIRSSTGRLCLDPVPPHFIIETIGFLLSKCGVSPFNTLGTSSRPVNQHADHEVIESLTIEQFHEICLHSHDLWHPKHIPPTKIVKLGAVIHRDHCTDAEIASLVDVEYQIEWDHGGDLMEDGWTRYPADDIFNTQLSAFLPYLVLSGTRDYLADIRAWLGQAHHIFTCRQITSHLEDYVLVTAVAFFLTISDSYTAPPPGYLFLCPSEALKAGPLTFKWPDCPAYWSLDPSGVDRLSTEEAMRLGFPLMEFRTEVFGRSWDASFYAGLRQFQEAKGFNPDSQDIARHLGYPLYRVSGAMDPPFAHADEIHVEEEVDENDSRATTGQTPSTAQSPVEEVPEDNPTEECGISRDTDPDSPWFNFVMHTQLSLIFFLFICKMYEKL